MIRNITFTAEEELIERARTRAKAERSTLNEKFRDWLHRYAGMDQATDVRSLMGRFSYVRPGRGFHRDDTNRR